LEVCDANDSISERSYLHKESFHINCALSICKEKVMNILPVARSSLGYKHTKNRRLKMSLSHSKPIIITNVVSGETCTYSSIKQGAENLKTSSTTISRYINNKKVYGNYTITKKKVP
jgi:hypothetical protein